METTVYEYGARSTSPHPRTGGHEEVAATPLRAQFATVAGLLGSRVLSTSLAGLEESLSALLLDAGAGVGITADLLRLLPQLASLGSGGATEPAVAITRGLLGVAATGSVAVGEPDRASRLLHVLARRHIVLLPVASIVADLNSAAPCLVEWQRHGRRYVTFITGPSRTADIEKTLTVGVHGPGELIVLIVHGWSPDAH